MSMARKEQTECSAGTIALIEMLGEGSTPERRRNAAEELGRSGDASAVPPLCTCLRDGDKEVRASAAAALGRLGAPAVPPLLGLLTDRDWHVRYRAAEALGLIRERRAVPALVAALADSRDHVRYMAAKSLGAIGDAAAIEPLIAAIADGNEFVRRSVAAALGLLGGDAARRALRGRLDAEPCEGVRAAIEAALEARG
jgi:HEAT repeat protein